METKKTCSTCMFFEPRTKFCRKNPPMPLTVDEKMTKYTTAIFAKIQMPDVDWCGEWNDGSINVD